jgi:hypothetical protein
MCWAGRPAGGGRGPGPGCPAASAAAGVTRRMLGPLCPVSTLASTPAASLAFLPNAVSGLLPLPSQLKCCLQHGVILRHKTRRV